MFVNRNRNRIMNIYSKILSDKKANKKSFALLIDPDKQDKSELISVIESDSYGGPERTFYFKRELKEKLIL